MTLGSLRNEKLCNIFNILLQQPRFLFNKQAEVSVIIDHPAPLQPLRASGRHSAGEENSWKIKFGKVRVSVFWWGNIWQCCLHPKQAAPEIRCLCWGMMGVQPGVQAGFVALSPTSPSIPSLQHCGTASPLFPAGLSHQNASAPLHTEPRHFTWGADASPAT